MRLALVTRDGVMEKLEEITLRLSNVLVYLNTPKGQGDPDASDLS